MNKKLLTLLPVLALGLTSCELLGGLTGGSEDSEGTSSAVTGDSSSSTEETGGSSSETGGSTSEGGTSDSSSSSTGFSSSSSSSSEDDSPKGRIEANAETVDYASRPGPGNSGVVRLNAFDGLSTFTLTSTHSYRSDTGLFRMTNASTLTLDTEIASIEGIEIVYSFGTGEGAATISFGHASDIDIASFSFDSGTSFSLTGGEDFSSGYSYFNLVTAREITIEEINIDYSNTRTDYLSSVSMSLTSDHYDHGTRVSDTVSSVSVSYSNGRTIAVPSNLYNLEGTSGGVSVNASTVLSSVHDGTLSLQAEYWGVRSPSRTAFVYDFDNPPAVTSIVATPSSISLYPGESYKFSYTYEPLDVDPSLIAVTSSNERVATVENGYIKGVGEGTCVIEIASVSGNVSDSIAVTVTAVDGLSVSPVGFTAKDWGVEYAPSMGEQKILLVPIALAGNTTYTWTQATLDEIEDSHFNRDNPDSLATYYDYASNGRMHVTGEVYGTIDHMYQAEYTESQLQNDSDMTRCYDMFESCLEWLYQQDDLDLDSYDSDDDGWIDSIHFFVDGSDNDSWGASIWPHMATVYMEAGTKAEPTIMSYSLSNLGHLDGAMTTIHEQGHIYGVEDYYDYSTDRQGYAYVDLVGYYDLQDGNSGDWNSFSKMSMGWVDPIYLDLSSGESRTITLKPSALGGSPLVLASNWNGSAYDEYVMLELFTRDGNHALHWDQYERSVYEDLGNGGVRLYHVDARLWQYSGAFSNGSYYSGTGTFSNSLTYQVAHNNSYIGSDYATYSAAPTYRAGNVSDVAAYNLLHLIQADGTDNYSNPNAYNYQYLNEDDMFQTGDRFSMSSFGNAFFYNRTTLNNGDSFPYTVEFDSVTTSGATITVTRN